MELTYENIEKFFKGYFADYVKYCQTAENQHKMDKYYAPDFVGKFGDTPQINGRDAWYKTCLHPDILDNLVPLRLIIDERKKEVAIALTTKLTNTKTGKVIIAFSFTALYTLKLDEKKTIKVTRIDSLYMDGNTQKIVDNLIPPK
jgi:hypothetical protein